MSMQHLITSFGSFMEVTGAALAIGKSWYYLVDYTWLNGKWVTFDPGEEYDLVATNEEDTEILLNQLCHTEAGEMLKICMAPNNDE